MSAVLVDIYASEKIAEMYLYVRQSEGLSRVPDALLERFGANRRVMPLVMKADTRLARADAERVLNALDKEGYYLQMPPQPDGYMAELHERNAKFSDRP